ncbi:hypothetical protein EMCRGX_G017550 [Ephydatia muelleri]|eukprot:Em0012g88a
MKKQKNLSPVYQNKSEKRARDDDEALGVCDDGYIGMNDGFCECNISRGGGAGEGDGYGEDVEDDVLVQTMARVKTLKMMIAAILKTPTSSFNINFIDVQTQMGSNDCGIFAIAFAVALCSERDPHMETYEQNEMRNHLHQCFSAGKLNNFPPSPNSHGTLQRHNPVEDLCSAVNAKSGTI